MTADAVLPLLFTARLLFHGPYAGPRIYLFHDSGAEKNCMGTTRKSSSQALPRHSEGLQYLRLLALVRASRAAMEEEAAANEEFDRFLHQRHQGCVNGTAFRHRRHLFLGTFRIIGSGIGISLGHAAESAGPSAIFLIIYNIPNFWSAITGYSSGTSLGAGSIDTLVSGGLMNRATKAASVMGLTVIGGMIASMVSIKNCAGGQFRSRRHPLNIQGIFDEICPASCP